MFRPIAFSSLAAVPVALFAAAAAQAVPRVASPPATANAAILFPLEIIKNHDLDFGYLAAPTAAGTAVIDPETDTISGAGGVLLLGGSPHAAQFTGAAKSNNVVIIRIPKQP